MSKQYLFVSVVLVALIIVEVVVGRVELTGNVVYRKDSVQYKAAHLDWNQAPGEKFPEVIVFCNTVQDVVNAVKYASENGIGFAVRSGRHSYEAFSLYGELIIDLSQMKGRTILQDKRLAVFESGNKLIEVYNTAMQSGFAFPGGTCPTVGLAGFTLGGGYGFSSRMYGLSSDNLVAAEIVTAQGEVIQANATNNYSDLFWAIRGAGNSNFGIVTSFTFQLHTISSPITICRLSWSNWDHIEDAFNYWQNFAPAADDRVTAQFTVYHNTFASLIQFFGTQSELQQLIKPYVQIGNPDVFIKTVTWEELVLFLSGCDTMKQCLEQAEWTPLSTTTQFWKGKSSYAYDNLSAAGLKTLLYHMGPNFQNSTTGFAGVLIDSLGGKINQTAPDQTAFVHRYAKYHLQTMIYWNGPEEQSASLQWVNNFYNDMRQHLSQYSYVNYCDSDIQDYEIAYYGKNINRLRGIKQKYDPSNLFSYPQSIRLQ